MRCKTAEIGERVRKARRRKGLTQAQLAGRAGCSGSLISRIETGSTAPTVERVVAIARGLGIAAASLVRGLDRERVAS